MRGNPDIVTRRELRGLPEVGRKFKGHRSTLGWPIRQSIAVWDMSVNDIQSNSPEDCLPGDLREVKPSGFAGAYQIPPQRIIMCRLLYKKYTAEQANARCSEIHGSTFDGRYVSGRYWVYWRKG